MSVLSNETMEFMDSFFLLAGFKCNSYKYWVKGQLEHIPGVRWLTATCPPQIHACYINTAVAVLPAS